MSLTKAEIVEYLVKQNPDFSKKEAGQLVDSFFDTIADSLVEGDQVKVSGLGTFDVRQKAARPGLNPKTLEQHTVSARTVVTFKAGKKLKSDIESNQ